jgi:hypothetical protein
MNRIFVSYRTSDGKKDANRLAEDLNRVFGDDQVFFDKHDLQGGAAWRDAIGDALGQRPVVLVLMTPDLTGAAHPEGGRRIDHPDDPIRMELVSAHAQGALIVPLLTEGMVMLGAGALPPDLRFMSEAHALKLRTDDWGHDLARLIADLNRHGVQPRAGAQALLAAPVPQDLGAVRVVFWVAVVLYLVFIIAANDEPDEETWAGVAFLSLIPLGMFVYSFRRLRAAGRTSRWAALTLAVLCGLLALSATINAIVPQAPAAAAVGYLPPVTSTTAPVV